MKNRRIFYIIVLAIVIRIIIAPFSYHPWEYRTYNNTCADIHDGVNPYTHFWELTDVVRNGEDHQIDYYEYWAYSPAGLVWLTVLSPLDPEPIDPFLDMNEQTPDPVLSLLFKVPSIIADIVCGLLLYALAIRIGHKNPYIVFKYWLLMPLPWFFSSVWGGFDSIVLACMLSAIIFVQKPLCSGISIGIGIAVKTIPVFIGPVFMAVTPVKRWPTLVFSSILIVFLACLYYLINSPGDLMGAMIGFHGSRYGGGLTIYNVWQLGQQNVFWDIVFKYIWLIPLFGMWFYIWVKARKSGDIIKGCALTMIVFVLASKLVNPAYMLYVMPFLLLYIKSVKQILIWQIFILLWICLNIGIFSFFSYPLGVLGVSVPKIPLTVAYMCYLGFGWLVWVMNITLLRDVLKWNGGKNENLS